MKYDTLSNLMPECGLVTSVIETEVDEPYNDWY